MSPLTLTFIALGVSADAFAVAMGKGLNMRRLDVRAVGAIALAFGGFQAGMPLLGWSLGSQTERFVAELDHWVAFGLLVSVGAKMLWDCRPSGEGATGPVLGVRQLLLLASATSVDALAVGISFAFLPVAILPAVLLIGLTTTLMALVGVLLGHRAGARWRRPAELAGAVVLILIGCRILVDHLHLL